MSDIWIPLLSALVGALFGGAVSFVLQRQRIKHEQAQLREADKTTFAAEDTVRRMLKHGGYTERTLGAIRDKVGGYDNDLDELRRILLRAGATRVKLGGDGHKKSRPTWSGFKLVGGGLTGPVWSECPPGWRLCAP